MRLQAKQVIPCFLVALILSILALPAWGASKADDEKTLSNAVTVLHAMTHSKDVPTGVIAKADCIIILPSVKKFAVGIGGTGGRGPMSCRTGKDFNGKWSPPAMYTIGGASAGLQIGGTATDYILLVMTQGAVEKALNGKLKMGTDATAALGPGASAGSGAVTGADILTYSRTSGAFAGVSLNGATLDPDVDANARLYGAGNTARQIITGHDVKLTPGGRSLVSVLDSEAAKKQ